MSDYNELYQQIILEHNKKPRNFKVLESANAYSLGKNPLCGDQFAIYTKLDEAGKIEDIMRDNIYKSTLDWQTSEELRDAAVIGFEIYQEMERIECP